MWRPGMVVWSNKASVGHFLNREVNMTVTFKNGDGHKSLDYLFIGGHSGTHSRQRLQTRPADRFPAGGRCVCSIPVGRLSSQRAPGHR
jgi:hypothetical protein